MKYQCKICYSTQEHQLVFAREMMFGFRDEFLYFKCSDCGCLQIAEIPKDLSKYYPKNYLPYQQIQVGRFRKMIEYFLVKVYTYTNGLTILRYLPHLRVLKVSTLLRILKGFNFNKKIPILDVGCGIGSFLLQIKNWGYSNLTGIDPFIDKDILYPSGVKILKQTINECNGRYDLIMLHHSFEHMSDPHTVFKNLYRLLNNSGSILLRIPVSDSFAFRKYQNNWYQLDAPRHFFLHTTKSINYLAQNNGFYLEDIIYDSDEYQILCSEDYCRDITFIPFIDQKRIKNTLSRIKKLKKVAKYLNDIKDGDQCIFVLSKQRDINIQ